MLKNKHDAFHAPASVGGIYLLVSSSLESCHPVGKKYVLLSNDMSFLLQGKESFKLRVLFVSINLLRDFRKYREMLVKR